MRISHHEIDLLINEDVPYIDLTCSLLGIDSQRAKISYITREDGVVAGSEQVQKMFEIEGITLTHIKPSGTSIHKGDLLIAGEGTAKAIHTIWKIGQNVLDYCSGIASTTRKMADICAKAERKIALLTTRKNIPGTKQLAIAGIMAGGAMPHRLGLSETVLIFAQHRKFFQDDAALAAKIAEIRHLAIEKRIVIEADNLNEALRFSSMGADIIQFDKMSVTALLEAVPVLRKQFPHIRILAAGGINPQNIHEFITTDVDGIVTTAPYYAKALDVKVEIEPLN